LIVYCLFSALIVVIYRNTQYSVKIGLKIPLMVTKFFILGGYFHNVDKNEIYKEGDTSTSFVN